MNLVIARLTVRSVLGRRRAWLLLVLPIVLIGISLVVRGVNVSGEPTAVTVLQPFGLGTVLPLLALIAGTGVIGPEIDDGEIVYLLTKPVPRWIITTTKFVVATGVTIVFAAVPTFLAGLILTGTAGHIAVAFAVATALAAVAYSALFVALAVVSRHAVVIGLVYALIWESLIGSLVPGARTLSIQQWGYSITDGISSAVAVDASVRLVVAVPLLVVVSAAGVWFAGYKLRRLSFAGDS